jgi:hypothetical protein
LANEVTQDERDIASSAAIPETAPKTSDGSFITLSSVLFLEWQQMKRYLARLE